MGREILWCWNQCHLTDPGVLTRFQDHGTGIVLKNSVEICGMRLDLFRVSCEGWERDILAEHQIKGCTYLQMSLERHPTAEVEQRGAREERLGTLGAYRMVAFAVSWALLGFPVVGELPRQKPMIRRQGTYQRTAYGLTSAT
jgi:hypothetical protein